MDTVTILPIQMRALRCCKVVPYIGSLAGERSIKGQTEVLYTLRAYVHGYKDTQFAVFWPYPALIQVTRTRTGLQLTN